SQQSESACASGRAACTELQTQSAVVEFIMDHADVLFCSTSGPDLTHLSRAGTWKWKKALQLNRANSTQPSTFHLKAWENHPLGPNGNHSAIPGSPQKPDVVVLAGELSPCQAKRSRANSDDALCASTHGELLGSTNGCGSDDSLQRNNEDGEKELIQVQVLVSPGSAEVADPRLPDTTGTSLDCDPVPLQCSPAQAQPGCPDSSTSVQEQFTLTQRLIGQWQCRPASASLSLVIGSAVPPSPVSHWSSAVLSRLRQRLIGQRQCRPTPASLSLVIGRAILPSPASYWSVEVTSRPCQSLIGQWQRRPASASLALVIGSTVPPQAASYWSSAALSPPCQSLIGQRQCCPSPAAYHWSVAAPSRPHQPLIGHRKHCPALASISLVIDSSVPHSPDSLVSGNAVPPPPASYWSSAAQSRPRQPLIGHRQHHPTPASLSLVSGSTVPPQAASYWSSAALSHPRQPLIGHRQCRPTPVCLSLVIGSTVPPSPASYSL
ncbi:uncharacterized protein LOC122162649, partial [Centrocercus urophasianus]|uniref:uncharacterized protein LOC122162649 n=1 Tax=Centrocercus urophasianus TaxID=9002 RepID=UPI001C64A7C7